MRSLRVLLALCLVAAGMASGVADADALPLFEVGTAVADISPATPQYLGGYDAMETPTADVNDPLQVRAFFVGRGSTAVAFAIVDSQGWFAGYQEGPFGITEARQEAAARISALGRYSMTQASIIVSSTHSHAAPTIMGIWGPTDPAYLRLVHDRTVDALVAAASSTKSAELWTGSASIDSIIAHNVEGTDHYDGWAIDADTPYLWAREPGTGATIATYVNVPVHADTYRGSRYRKASADHPGVVRSLLDRALGGTTVVAMGTLGRQETIGSGNDYNEVVRDARYQTNQIERGMVFARPIGDSSLAAAEQYIATPATNAALMALNYDNARGFECVDGVACTIDRSLLPPYLAGNMVGTWVTTFRIGAEVWASEPGEAFPEVAEAIRASITGARSVHVVGMAQDQLGYFYPPEDYPSTELNPSDFLLFNVGPALADQTVQANALNANLLGFASVPRHPLMADDDPTAYLGPGVQFFPVVAESVNPTVSFTVSAKGSGSVIPAGSHDVSAVRWDFDDGTTTTTGGDTEFDHTFPGPDTYDVTATVDDGAGKTRTFTQRVIVDAPLDPFVSDDGTTWSAGLNGGDYAVLAAHWLLSNGTTDDGISIPKPPTGVSATVTIVDGAGDTAVAHI